MKTNINKVVYFRNTLKYNEIERDTRELVNMKFEVTLHYEDRKTGETHSLTQQFDVSSSDKALALAKQKLVNREIHKYLGSVLRLAQ